MSEDLTPSFAPSAGEGWGEGAANAAEPRPQTQSATGSKEEAQFHTETVESAAGPVPSPAGEVAEPGQSLAGEAPSPAEPGQSLAGEARSPAEQEQFPAAEAPSPVGEEPALTNDTRSSVEAPSEAPAEAPLPAEPAREPEALVSGQPEPESTAGSPDAAREDPAAPPEETPVPVDTAPDEDSLRVAEALVFASAAPVSARALSQLLPDAIDADAVIAALRDRYAGRGVEVVETAGGIQFRTAPDIAPRLRKVIEVPRKLPRVAMETLAIIAYHQPCTRAEIEEIRGTSLSQQTLDALLEANLVAPKGRREVPGRPTLWGTTQQFLAQFGLKDIRDLPQRGDLLLEPPKPSGVSDAPPLAADLSEQPADTISAEETGSAALSQG
jgi:segregation and condensation protein B